MTDQTPRLGHCTPVWGGHSPACDRDGTYCSENSSHTGPCKPHGKPIRYAHPDHVTVSGPDHVTGIDWSPMGHGPECAACHP